jgi:PEP-CTERM putative exosortase interaction domain
MEELMTRKSLRLFVQITLLGLLCGASSSAYADAFSITSVTFGNLQITPASGTVQFTPTASSAVALATNNLPQTAPVMSNAFPIAQASTAVTFASSSGVANATTFSANTNSQLTITGCTCQASSAGQANLSGTFVITGGEGNVNVNIAALFTTIQSITTDLNGSFSQSQAITTLTLDGVALFDVTTILNIGRNASDQQSAINQISQAVSLQFNVPHTISIHIHAGSLAGNEVPEPATAVLLFSGLGLMAGYIRKRKTTP